MRFRWIILLFISLLSISCTLPSKTTPINKPLEPIIPIRLSDVKENSIALNFSASSPFPIWSELSEFENQVLNDLLKAKDGEPDTLLALSLLASGDIREMGSFETIKNRVHEFITRVRPKIDRAKTVKKKGDLLHKMMHHTFFLPAQKNKTPGYDYSQSTVSGIFTTRKYNCISSAILYMILCRHFDLDVKGAVLPDHVFVELSDPVNGVIPVETTSREGYNQVHDKAFYHEQKDRWYHFREASNTYEEYLNREHLPCYKLIAYNMNNQHTSEKRMGTAARFRLAEIRAYITKFERDAQYNRLTHYNNLIIEYEREERLGHLPPLLERLSPDFKALRIKWQDDKEMLNIITWLEYYELHALQQSGQYERAMQKQLRYVKRLNENLKDVITLSSNHIFLMNQHLKFQMAEKRYADAEKALRQFNDACQSFFDLNELNFWLYSKWALNDWDYSRWEKAVEKFITSLRYAETDANRKRVLKNIEGAYYNWSISYSNKGNYRLAAMILEKGIRAFPQMKKLESYLAELKGQY